MFEPWVPFLKSKGKIRMSRIAAFTLLVALSASWSIPAKAQGTVLQNMCASPGRRTKKQPKNIESTEKYVKAQRKALKR